MVHSTHIDPTDHYGSAPKSHTCDVVGKSSYFMALRFLKRLCGTFDESSVHVSKYCIYRGEPAKAAATLAIVSYYACKPSYRVAVTKHLWECRKLLLSLRHWYVSSWSNTGLRFCLKSLP
eukprot:scaffold541257_cov18-Prasinocladus_malaysianus.AAC.1